MAAPGNSMGLAEPDFEKRGGLIPAVAQDSKDGTVLMVSYMNREAFENTLKTGRATYWSTSKNKIWVKGETSGNEQIVKDVLIDCDNDCILLKVVQKGDAACHTGYRTCFYRSIKDGKEKIIGKKVFDPEKVYGKKE